MSETTKAVEAFDLADPDAIFLTPEQAADVLRQRGLNISHYKLKTLRTTSDGPRYCRNPSKRPVYLHHRDPARSPLIAYAATQLAPPASSTSEEWENHQKLARDHRRGH